MLKQKAAAADAAKEAVQEAVNLIEEEQKKLQKLRDKSAQLDKERCKLQQDYEAAVTAKAEMQKRAAAKTCDATGQTASGQMRDFANAKTQQTADKQLFRDWLQSTEAAVYDVLEGQQWQIGTYSGKLITQFNQWEAHYDRILRAMEAVQQAMDADWSPDTQAVVSEADAFAVFMYQCAKPHFPPKVEWIRQKLAEQCKEPIRENIQKRLAEEPIEQPASKKLHTAGVAVSSPFLLKDGKVNKSLSTTRSKWTATRAKGPTLLICGKQTEQTKWATCQIICPIYQTTPDTYLNNSTEQSCRWRKVDWVNYQGTRSIWHQCVQGSIGPLLVNKIEP